MRDIATIERELHAAREDLRGKLPTHERVGRCERLYEELQRARGDYVIAADIARNLNF